MAGRFVVFEGIDGSGTTSQVDAVAAALRAQGADVLTTREPSRGAIGRMVREHLSTDVEPLDPAALALMFAADRRDHLARVVQPALAAGKTVLCDRYVLSSLAYQSLDHDPEWIQSINGGIQTPDITLFLRISSELARARVGARGGPEEVFDGDETQRRVAENYERFLEAPLVGPVRILDGTSALDEVTQAALEALSDPTAGGP